MDIKRFIRDNDFVTVVLGDDSGNIEIRRFAKSMTDDEIKKALVGNIIPKKKADVDIDPEKVNTVPTPPVTLRPRISRDQMISALELAGMKVDFNDPVKLKAAYKELQDKLK